MKHKILSRFVGTGRALRWRIVALIITVALLPLFLTGFGSWIVFGNLLENKSVELMRSSVQRHADAIDAYLADCRHLLEAISETHRLEDLAKPDRLKTVLENLNHISGQGFIDLGVIDAEGNHRAYVGPYDLQNRNYHDADWFAEVLARGKYISDVFMGYRQVPHCIIAVHAAGTGQAWVLRATINSAKFDELVRTGFLTDGSEVFIVNRDGIYQTTPRDGQLLDTSTVSQLVRHSGVKDFRVDLDGNTKIRVTTWLNDNRWMLVVQQDLAAVQAPVNQAIARGAWLVLITVALLILTTFLATWHLTQKIDKATAEREEMSQAFVRSAKLASIGELTTGLAHEINNPLAIISAEQTNIADIIKDDAAGPEDFEQALESVRRCQNQVNRCAAITRKLLQFGRKKETNIEPTPLPPRLTEIKALMERQARLRNIEIVLNAPEDLPPVLVDSIELEQVVVNLINNAFDVMPDGGSITIGAKVESDRVALTVADTGTGVPSEIIDRIFEPFFTTKPVGKGTGLGLSVCYGIIQSWGGAIEVESKPGKGTAFKILLYYRDKQKIENRDSE